MKHPSPPAGYWHRLALACVIGSALLIVPSMALAATGWSAPTNIDGTNAFESVSCPSASFCAAVDNGRNAVTYNGNSWSISATDDPPCTQSSRCRGSPARPRP